jgi:hypothetical protein
MRMDVDTRALDGAAAALRTTAADVDTVDPPRAPGLESILVEDAVGALLRVAAEQRERIADTLRAAAVLIETAAADYARAEARATR